MSAELSIWTLYERPSDYPGGYVLRRFSISQGTGTPTDDVHRADTADELRAIMQRQHLHRLPRQPQDEPQIVECWL